MSTIKEKSSSSGIVFAKPTKQWVIPERAKPGRKAKVKIESTAVSGHAGGGGGGGGGISSTPSPSPSSTSIPLPNANATEPSTTTTTTTTPPSSSAQTNREAQRNFRLRKSSYITSLETRISAFERGEFERSKELQNSALAVKEENEVLKRENRRLRSEVGVLRSEIRRVGNEVERLRGVKITASMAKKKVVAMENSKEVTPITPITPPSDNQQMDGRIRRGSINVSPNRNGRRSSFPNHQVGGVTPIPVPVPVPVPSSPQLETLPTQPKQSILACGFCTDVETICVCQMVAEAENGMINTSIEDNNNNNNIQPETSHSILENLPTPEPAVPLPRRTDRKRRTSSVLLSGGESSWWISSSNSNVEPNFGVEIPVVDLTKYSGLISLAQCSGDPRNCDACRDDDFGRQFCERLTSTVCAESACGERCARCTEKSSPSFPSTDAFITDTFTTSHSATHIEAPCCGDGEICGKKPSACSGDNTAVGMSITLPSIADALQNVARLDTAVELRGAGAGHGETMGADEAWRTLKAHPNAQYASLDMLADVVARRTKCYGPRVELSPPPPETEMASAPHRQLVPLDELVVTRSKRRLEVQADAVRDALALLDAQPRKRMKIGLDTETDA